MTTIGKARRMNTGTDIKEKRLFGQKWSDKPEGVSQELPNQNTLHPSSKRPPYFMYSMNLMTASAIAIVMGINEGVGHS